MRAAPPPVAAARRHSRADHDQVLVLKGALAVLSGFDRNSLLQQRRDFLVKLLLRLGIGNRTRAPRACKNSAEATPDLPRPTTRTFCPLTSMLCYEGIGGRE